MANSFWLADHDIDDLVPYDADPHENDGLLSEPPTSDLDTPAHGVEVWYPAGEDEDDE